MNNRNDRSSFGFTTASGNSINVSENALSKARKLFDELNETERFEGFEGAFEAENEINARNVQAPTAGFQTASGQRINVTNEALSKAKALFQEEMSKDFETAIAVPKALQKRKIKDMDDNVSLSKPKKSNEFKKLRFSREFQVPKTVYRDSRNIEEKENQNTSLILAEENLNHHVEFKLNDIVRTELNRQIDSSSISHEVASAVALLADEKDLDFTEQLSPKEKKEDDEVMDFPSSPVIGGQFILKKRKSIGKRKSTNKCKLNKPVDNLEKLTNNCASSNQCINSIGKQDSTNEENQCESVVANDFGDTQLMIDFINQSVTISQKRLEAALDQDKQISLKQRNKPKPTISKLYFHRKSNTKNRISWKEISKGKKPILCTYEELINKKLSPEILNITAENAVMYKFHCTDFYGQSIMESNIDGIKLEDGACLIMDENGYVGIKEIKRSFLASPGVDPNLLPTGWIENHYKWIVWKLASMDRVKLGSITLPRVLTPARVMMELKYRYDREIDRSQRSALRKILEKDDVAIKRMVLCVSSITECDDSVENKNLLKLPFKKLILTDGWYSIQASIDEAMMKHVISGKVKEGTKLLMYGSELLNCDQGCPPLEVPNNVYLKLHTNSTRRAKWDTKLGYIVPSGPICVKLKTIYPNGGLIGKIKVTIARVYPMLYHEKTSSGESIFRNTRCEEKANIIYEKECRSIIEAFYAKAEKYFHTGNSKDNVNTDSIDLAAIEWNENCEKLSKEELLSEQEFKQLMSDCRMKEEQFRQKLESRLQESLPPPRHVTPLLKIRITEEETNAILSIWSPSEEILGILKEGNCISVCHVMPSAKSRGNELLLSASRNALFRQVNVSNNNFPRRAYTALYEINKPIFSPAYGEFDTVGIIISIGNEPYGMKNFQAVYLAYPHTNSQSSYLSVLFWHGISFHGYAEILTVGSFVACSNLEWRRATSWNVPMAYCTERSNFTRNPRDNHLQQPFEDLKRLITESGTYIDTCAVEISQKLPKKSITRSSFDKIGSDENINSDMQFNDHAPQESSRRSLTSNQPAKSIAVQKRLEKLQSYGEPSNLSPIILNNSSKRVSLEFQSPLRSRSEKYTKVHTLLKAKFPQNPR
ncbi:breast cancer type 2 susceptibility protein homolog isoform X1 [Frieseomelitta varia]|uniref:breast cancer type 2 susceptibility protein homolog isoform X1 n=1 Tax=Frieseomelitta varia TaxID=561572 RepID=UPI001CB67D3C|nr:breast cancer type 2 susceptibility protein homolog isoform X1 [Frieseomelitta varia]